MSGRGKKKAKTNGKAAPLAVAGARIDKFLARPVPAAQQAGKAKQARDPRFPGNHTRGIGHLQECVAQCTGQQLIAVQSLYRRHG